MSAVETEKSFIGTVGGVLSRRIPEWLGLRGKPEGYNNIKYSSKYYEETPNVEENMELYREAIGRIKEKYEGLYQEQLKNERYGFSSEKKRERYCEKHDISEDALNEQIKVLEDDLQNELDLAEAWVCYRNGDNKLAVKRNIVELEEEYGDSKMAKMLKKETKGMEVSNVWIAGLPDSLERIRIEKDLVPLCDWSWLKKLKEEREERFKKCKQENLSKELDEEGRPDGEVKPAEQQTKEVTSPSPEETEETEETEEKIKKRKERQIGD
ncbi:MAG: hypothetical protein PHD60_07600 [Clostridia bacterium]|nr:hypothetical protein [Clostridia bacterium]